MSLSVDKSIRKAKRYANAGEIQHAAALYRSVLEEYPGNKRASQGLSALDRRMPANRNSGSTPPPDKINALIALSDQGDAKAAIEGAWALSQQFPKSIELFNIIGVASLKLGLLDDAVAAFGKALAIDADCVEALWNLGGALQRQGRAEDALVCYEKARLIAPHRAEAHKNLGDAYLCLRRLKDATEVYERTLELKPDHPEACNNLGYALIELGRFEDAAATLEKAIEIKPDFAEAHNNLGNAYLHLRRVKDAKTAYESALKVKPEYAEALNNLGNAHLRLRRHHEAIAFCQKAVRLKPDFAEAYNSLGTALSDLGRRDDAAASYEKAVAAWPGFARAHHNLSFVKKFDDSDPQIDQMADLVTQDGVTDTEKTLLHFGLGKAYDDLEQYEDAFMHFAEGNRLRKKLIGYDIADDRELFSRIRAVQETITPSDNESKGATPIFIVGMPRSGTSLVEQILASHSKIHGAGELATLENSIKTLGVLDASNPCSLLADLAHDYRHTLNTRANDASHITDKMPLNFRWIGLIRAALPDAKIVHVKRDPRATCWSIFRRSFATGGNGYAYDLKDIADYYHLYQGLMAFWEEHFPGVIHHLNYEKLVVDQEAETRALLYHVGLDWEDACLAFDKTERAVATASAYQVKKPIYQGSSDAWRQYAPFIAPMIEQLSAD